MSNIAQAVSEVATALAASGTAAMVAATLARVRRTRQEVSLVRPESFEERLQTGDLASLSEYLWKEFGSVRLSDMVENDELQRRVTQTVDRLTEFVGSESAMQEPAPQTPDFDVPPAGMAVRSEDELAKVRNELREGDIWNALARLRRFIEVQLRSALGSQGIPGRTSASRMIDVAAQNDILPPDAAVFLKYAVNVANRGVHGLDTSPTEADQALHAAELGLSLLRDRHE